MRPFVLPSDGDGKVAACSGVGRGVAGRAPGGGVKVELEAEPLRETSTVPTTWEVWEPPFSQVRARIVFKDREKEAYFFC